MTTSVTDGKEGQKGCIVCKKQACEHNQLQSNVIPMATVGHQLDSVLNEPIAEVALTVMPELSVTSQGVTKPDIISSSLTNASSVTSSLVKTNANSGFDPLSLRTSSNICLQENKQSLFGNATNSNHDASISFSNPPSQSNSYTVSSLDKSICSVQAVLSTSEKNEISANERLKKFSLFSEKIAARRQMVARKSITRSDKASIVNNVKSSGSDRNTSGLSTYSDVVSSSAKEISNNSSITQTNKVKGAVKTLSTTSVIDVDKLPDSSGNPLIAKGSPSHAIDVDMLPDVPNSSNIPVLELANGKKLHLVPEGVVPTTIMEYVKNNYKAIVNAAGMKSNLARTNARLVVHENGTMEIKDTTNIHNSVKVKVSLTGNNFIIM